jgi:hypothetical protein
VTVVALLVILGILIPRTIKSDIDETTQVLNPIESLSYTPTIDEVKRALVYAAEIYSVNPVCITKISQCESHFQNVCNFKYGCNGGIGYMQLLESTAKHCSEKMGRIIDPHNPADNIECGAWLLKNEGTYHWGTQYTWWGSWDCWHSYCN